MKLLIVEGEQVAQESIMRYMKREGHLCESAAHFQEAYKKVVNHEYDCIILNPDLSGTDGMKLIRILKEQRSGVGIVIVSARDSANERVVTKDAIAEHLWGDYMEDPKSYNFIHAHIKNLRKKLARMGCGDYLKTVYGIGYKFTLNT